MQGRIQSLSFLPVTRKRQSSPTSVSRKRPSRPSMHHVGPLSEKPRFKAGDVISESGIYETIHENAHRDPHEVVMIKSDLFPPCDTCADRVRFRLIRSAPYIFSDVDFEQSE
jgi:hypothetical protein